MPVSFGCVYGHIFSDIIITCFNFYRTIVSFYHFFTAFFEVFFDCLSYLLTRWARYFKCFFVNCIYRVIVIVNFRLFLSISDDEDSGCWVLFLWETENSTFLFSSTCSSSTWLATISSSPDKLTDGTSIETLRKVFAL